jgi:hypothetical protein
VPTNEPVHARVRLAIVQCAARGGSHVLWLMPCSAQNDLDGEVRIEHTRPAADVTYIGNGRSPGQRPKTAETSPMS